MAPSFRVAYLAGFVACAGLLGFAYYAQYQLFLDPCPLCILQRVAFAAMAVAFLIGGLHAPRRWGRRVYGGLVSLAGLIGAGIAARHVYLQNLPPDQVPDCGPGLGYMLETLPVGTVLQKVLAGSGECAEISWSLLGLSMPAWTFLWYLGLTALAVVFGWRSGASRSAGA